jgi:hypothetical protein
MAIEPNYLLMIIVSLASVGYIILPLLFKPAQTIGTVTRVDRTIWGDGASLYSHLPTVEFMDEQGKRHFIKGALISRTIGKKWEVGESAKVWYHPKAPQRGVIAPSSLTLLVCALLLIGAIGLSLQPFVMR